MVTIRGGLAVFLRPGVRVLGWLRRQVRQAQEMETGGRAFVTVDVHYLGSGGARAAAVVTADARFSEVVAERTEDVADVLPYRPGEFYLRELPPIRTVLSGLSGLGLLVVDGYADLDPGGRPGLVRTRTLSSASR
jgi:deoxyinosine 3'endonuclease (endonuclease V)